MKRLFIYGIVSVCFSTALAQTFSKKSVDKTMNAQVNLRNLKTLAVHKLLQDQLTGWNEGDMNRYMKGYWNSDSLLFITSKGKTKGYQQVFTNYQKSYPTKEKMGTLNFEYDPFVFLDEKEEIVQVTGVWKVTYPDRTQSGHFSLIVKFWDLNPKIIIDHTF